MYTDQTYISLFKNRMNIKNKGETIDWRMEEIKVRTLSTRKLYIRMVESSIPTAMMLLSRGKNTRNVTAGDGAIHLIMT